MLVSMMVAAGLALQGAAAAAPRPAAKAEAGAAKAEKPKMVCVEETQLGSHFKKRICATPEQWEKRRELDAVALSRSGGKTPSPVCGAAA